MAHMNQEKKKIIAAALKKVVPADWKYSLRVCSSTIYMTIKSAPFDLLDFSSREHKCFREVKGVMVDVTSQNSKERGFAEIHEYHPEYNYSGKTLNIIKKIIGALSTNNFDRSDLMSDYFDVGHYVSLYIGMSSEKPFLLTK